MGSTRRSSSASLRRSGRWVRLRGSPLRQGGWPLKVGFHCVKGTHSCAADSICGMISQPSPPPVRFLLHGSTSRNCCSCRSCGSPRSSPSQIQLLLLLMRRGRGPPAVAEAAAAGAGATHHRRLGPPRYPRGYLDANLVGQAASALLRGNAAAGTCG